MLPSDKLRGAWESLIAEAGAFVEQVGIRREQVSPYTVVFATCRFAKSTMDIKVVFSVTGQVSGLWVVPSQGMAVPRPQ